MVQGDIEFFGSAGNNLAAGESYRVVARSGEQSSLMHSNGVLMHRKRLTPPQGYQPPHSQWKAAQGPE